MAKKIRFPLIMKNGAEVRSLEELQENFDLESVLRYFADGRLKTWLTDRYYDEKAEAIGALSTDMSDLNARICVIFGVEYEQGADETDIELIQRRNEKLKILSEITADKDILDNVDLVAMDQDELFDILDESPDKVYLYGEKFSIPFGRKNICYIGINKPLVILENGKKKFDYNDAEIIFENVTFEEGSELSVELAKQYFIEGRYQEAFPIIEKAAHDGDAHSMYILSLFYKYGYNTVKCNFKENEKWIIKSNGLGEKLAHYDFKVLMFPEDKEEQQDAISSVLPSIRRMAEKGDILACDLAGRLESDPFERKKWFKKAADAGFSNAQLHFGERYAYDNDNYEEAVKWIKKAILQGNAEAQALLGLWYSVGDDLPLNLNEAFNLLNKSANQKFPEGQVYLALMYEDGDGIQQDYKKAFELFSQAAEQEYPSALNELAYMYCNGLGVNQDYQKAFELYTQASELYDAESFYYLGILYWNGYGVKLDMAKAYEMFTIAAEYGNNKSKEYLSELYETEDSFIQCKIGDMFYYGDSVKTDYKKAYKWYAAAADNGNADAQYKIAYMYEHGEYVEKDEDEAFYWYKEAAENGNACARTRMGDYYGETDKRTAMMWYKKAAAQGDDGALVSYNLLKLWLEANGYYE